MSKLPKSKFIVCFEGSNHSINVKNEEQPTLSPASFTEYGRRTDTSGPRFYVCAAIALQARQLYIIRRSRHMLIDRHKKSLALQ